MKVNHNEYINRNFKASISLKRKAKKANITKRVTPHIFRHSYATHQVDKGVVIAKIQELLGHKDIKL